MKNNEDNIAKIVRFAEVLCMSPIVIGELLAGFDGGSKPKKNKLELQQFLEISRVVVYPITTDTSHFFSQLQFTLKKKGKPIPTNDIWIAAQALEHGCVVCTHDKHFSFIDGLITGDSPESLFM
jgi:predicted nucleic acid-binding protein